MRELNESYLGAPWELLKSSAVDGDDVALLGHYHVTAEQFILNLFFTSLMMPK
jgi:hypothetical protein